MPMWYWRADNFKGLADVYTVVRAIPELRDYAEYLQLREQGLRKPAFAHLDAFLRAARQWSFDQQRDFVDWLMTVHHNKPEIFDLIPHPLQVHLVEPTLVRWIEAEPCSPVPLRWRATPDDLRRAVALDSTEQIARERLLRHIVNAVDYSVHELQNGYGYIGEPSDDLMLLDEAQGLIQGLVDGNLKAACLERINLLQAIVQAYLEYRASGSPGSYVEWAGQHARPIRARVWQVYHYRRS